MKKIRFTKEQITYTLRQVAGGTPPLDVCWQLRDENARLKRLPSGSDARQEHTFGMSCEKSSEADTRCCASVDESRASKSCAPCMCSAQPQQRLVHAMSLLDSNGLSMPVAMRNLKAVLFLFTHDPSWSTLRPTAETRI